MQAYDSVVLDADIELGGGDQRFNVLLGRDIQTAYGKEEPQLAMLLPLLEGTDGIVKMSKTYPEHCISLNEEPNNMYGKLMSIPDNLIYRYYELLTDVSNIELDEIKTALVTGAVNPRDLKMRLAKTIVTQYYGDEIAQKAEDAFVNVVQKKAIPDDLKEQKQAEGDFITDIAVNLGFVSSKGEAKRLIQGGGIKLDGEKVSDIQAQLDYSGKESVVLQVGKRNFIRLVK